MPAAYSDLKGFIELLRKENELLEITEPVSTYLEITEIADRVSKSPSADSGGASAGAVTNKALLFTNVHDETGKKFDMPLLINATGNHKRMMLTLGVDNYEEIQDRIKFFIKPEIPGNLLEKLAMLPKLADLNNFIPRTFTGNAPCQEVVITDPSQPMLDKLPIITCWPKDAGPFITMPVFFTKDPATGERNAGMYRLQKYDNVTTGMHWHKHHDGARIYENARRMGKDRLEVAAALGCAPHVVYSATAPLPPRHR